MSKRKLSDKVKCWYCGAILGKSNTTTDHVVPKCKNGSDKASNLVDACIDCNREKNGLNLEDWRAVVAFRKGLLPPITMKFYGEK